MNNECPRCGQGSLCVATIKRTRQTIVVCDECEALWTEGKEPTADGFQDLVTFLRSNGIDDGWDALEIDETK